MDEIVSFCKRRGFIYAGSELYGSIGTGYDYGPYGSALKKNIQDKWWKDFVEKRPDCVGLDAALLSSPRVWQASGHVQQFVDPLSECNSCRKRVRADKLVQEAVRNRIQNSQPLPPLLAKPEAISALSLEQLHKAIIELNIHCPACNASGTAGLGTPRQFNLLFQTNVGPVFSTDPVVNHSSSSKSPVVASYAYLRPETAQGAFIHFLNIQTSTRRTLPIGIGQMGRSFRNEISLNNFIFRTREFDQMELEYFCHPEESGHKYKYWVEYCHRWLMNLGLTDTSIRLKEYTPKELAHYALATTDIEYKFPFGWDELWGIANRGDYDLQAHSKASGQALEYTDPTTNRTYVPHVVEPALGTNRLILALLSNNLGEERIVTKNGEEEPRTVFRIHPLLAPVKAAILPLMKKDELVLIAKQLHYSFLEHIPTEYDATKAIGKRYRRQDEIGTPWCITIDPQTIKDNTVTIRDRDTMQQSRISIELLQKLVSNHRLTMAALKENNIW